MTKDIEYNKTPYQGIDSESMDRDDKSPDSSDSPTLNDEKKNIFGVDRVEPMFGGGGRDWSIDVIRCLSCFMVCAIHATDKSFVYGISDAGTNEWLHNEIYRMALASPTVLFVMVSGIFFLSPERNVTAKKVWKKNVIKMTFAYVFWSLIYALYRIHTMDPQPDLTWGLLVKEWIVQEVHLWYIPMIVGLYIISPVLRPIAATYNTKLFRYIILIFMGGMVLWTVYNWPRPEGTETSIIPILEKTPMNLICQYPFWMLFGWIAYTYRPRKGLRIIIYIIGILALIVGIRLNMYNYLNTGILDLTAVTQKFGILQFLKNVALFYFIVTIFRTHEFSKAGKAILKKWSDCTLIIYLVHYLIILMLYDNNVFYSSGMSPWVGIWVYAFVAYFGGGLVAFIFHLFWDPIRNDIYSRKTRSERVYEKLEKKRNKRG